MGFRGSKKWYIHTFSPVTQGSIFSILKICVKNFEESDTLSPRGQANKLACCSLMDPGRRCKTFDSEMKKSEVYYSISNCRDISMYPLSPNSYRMVQRGLDNTCTHTAYVTRTLILGLLNLLEMCSFSSEGETLALSSRAILYTSKLQWTVWSKG